LRPGRPAPEPGAPAVGSASRWMMFLALSLLVLACVLGAPRPTLARPSAEPTALTFPADRAALKGMTGHWWHLDRYGGRLLDEYARLGVTNVRLSVDWVLIEPAEGQRN